MVLCTVRNRTIQNDWQEYHLPGGWRALIISRSIGFCVGCTTHPYRDTSMIRCVEKRI